ncbi:MAG TPA: UPF0182 family protein [Gemmatimonadales bacterium]|nr:UPF0182 family protein [Gemmatimonadales bacterium]
MSARARRLVVALVALGGLLFAGRWAAQLLADRWWAGEISPAAVTFLTGWHLLRGTLEAGGILVAGAWFTGHLLVVYRAIGSVQIARHVANLEIREAITSDLLLAIAVGGGLLLGVLAGSGGAGWGSTVALAWEGLSYGIREPVFGHDLGLYIAQLPLWRALHNFAFLLTALSLVICFALYSLVGAIRWVEGRPAINDHARAHLGWILVVLALVFAWGYLLEPYELVAGIHGVPDRSAVELSAVVSPALTGTALMVAVMSALWASRARHALAAAGWLVLVLASLVGHYVLPAFVGDPGTPAVDTALTRQLERTALGLDALGDSTDASIFADASPPTVAPLWDERGVAEALRSELRDARDTRDLRDPAAIRADPAVLTVERRRLPVWLVLRSVGDRGPGSSAPAVLAVAADRVSATGEPLFYRLGDTLAYPTPYTLLELSAHAFHPRAVEPDLHRQARGPTLDSWTRRLVLAWSLQIGRLLGALPPGARLAWRRSPAERFAALMPFAEWGRPVARVIDGELVWLADGFLVSATFPLVERIPWRDGAASSVRAGFIGVIRAESGETRLYLRPDGGALAQAWADVAAGVVRPAAELPRNVAVALAYPVELFEGQARALERSAWNAGALSGRPETGVGEPAPAERGWLPGAAGTRVVAIYERPVGRRVSTLLGATMDDGLPRLRLVRADTGATLPAPRMLEETWNRFPSYQRLAESVRAGVARVDTLARGPLVVWRGADTLGAYRARFAHRPGGGVALVWVSVAYGRRVGAGRTLAAAWDNLLGGSAPLPPVLPSATLDEARRWVQIADSALRSGDWSGFGRAFDALRQVLAAPTDSIRRDSVP